MVGSRHTQVTCEKEANEKEGNLFTSLLNKAALSVRLISNIFKDLGEVSFSPFLNVLFLFSSLLPVSVSAVGSQSR